MKTVNFYSCEVKCSGNVYRCSKEDLFATAKMMFERGIDCFDFSKELEDNIAEKMDGDMFIEFSPKTNSVRVNWSNIEE